MDRFGVPVNINNIFGGSGSSYKIGIGDFQRSFENYAKEKSAFRDPNELFYMRVANFADKEVRHSINELYAETSGMQSLFDQATSRGPVPGALPAYDRSMADGLGFKVLKSTSPFEKGFGNFFLPRDYFLDPTKTVDSQLMRTLTSSVNFEEVGSSVGRFTAGQKILREEVLQNTADQINQMRAGKFDLGSAKRAVIDIETAGLNKNGVWQMSVRLLEGDKEITSKNIIMDAAQMDAGTYVGKGGKRYSSFREFFTQEKGYKGPWLDFNQGMRELLDIVDQADYIVGQNVSFDLSEQFYEAKKYGIDVADDTKAAFARFNAKALNGKTIDTRLLLAPLLGESIEVADELSRIGKTTQYSLENIYLQTSFIEDVVNKYQGMADAGTLSSASRARIKGEYYRGSTEGQWVRNAIESRFKQGLHFADVDTFLTDELLGLINSGFAGESVLRAQKMADGEIRGLIAGASAITPVTKQILGEGRELTGIQIAAFDARREAGALRTAQTSSNMMNTFLGTSGITDWVDSVIDDSGRLKGTVGLNANAKFKSLRARAIKEGMATGGLSHNEYIINNLLGRIGSPLMGGSESRNRFINQASGGFSFVGEDSARIMASSNVALPLGLIEAAEKEVGLFGSNFTKNRAFKLSKFEYGQNYADIAVVADLFDEGEEGAAQVKRFQGFIEKLSQKQLDEFNIKEGMVKEIVGALGESGQRYGVQIGLVSGAMKTKGNVDPTIMKLVGFLESNNLGIDRKQTALVGSLAGSEIINNNRVIRATGVRLDLPDWAETIIGQDQSKIINRTMQTIEAGKEIFSNNVQRRAVDKAKYLNQSELASKAYNFVVKAADNLPRKLGIAGLAAAGLYMFNREQEQEPYEATFAQQGYQTELDYYDYKSSLGEPSFTSGQELVARSAPPPDTRNLVGNMDRMRSQRHRMGSSSGKYDHLFG